jgi:hypothetical protein
MIRKIVGPLFFALSFLANAAEQDLEKMRANAYSDAQALGRCAGYLKFVSIVHDSRKQPMQAKDAKQKSNGWRIATMGALFAAGWKSEVSTTAESIFEGAVTGWLARAEAQDPELGVALIQENNFCLSINEKQELYRELMKRIAYERQ